MSHLILAALLLFIQPAHSAGETVSLTESGIAHMRLVSEKIGKALVYALTVLGASYEPTAGGGRYIMPFHPGAPAFGDNTVIASEPVSPDAEPTYNGIGLDMFGNAAGTDGSLPMMTEMKSYHNVGPNANTCSGLSTNPVVKSGSCPGGVTSVKAVTVTMRTMFNNHPWWHPNCSCFEACAIGTGGCPFTAENPCTPYGDGEDAWTRTLYSYCADPHITAETTAISLATQYRPAGQYQPEQFAAADIAETAAARSNIENAKAWLDTNVAPALLSDPTTAMGKTYAAISEGAAAFSSPTQLITGEYTYPAGSAATNTGSCSTCAVTSPSTSSVQNVWIMNGQQHVWIDNPQAMSSVTVNVSISSVVTIADATALEPSTFTLFTDTLTLAGVYAEFVATRSSNPLMGLLSNFTIAVSTTATFDTNMCLPTPARFGGPHCVDINANGHWSALVFILKWSVICSALIAAYFVIYS